MKPLLRILATVAGLALTAADPVWASDAVDTDLDGVLTLDEVQAAHPDITEETFAAMDLNADGALDAAETRAAREAGVLPDAQG